MKRLALPVLLCLLFLGGISISLAASTKPTPVPIVSTRDVSGEVGAKDEACPAKLVCVDFDGYTYDLDPGDGPAIAFPVKRIETRDGASIEGVMFLRDADGGYVVAGTFVGTTGDPLSATKVDEELVLTPLESAS